MITTKGSLTYAPETQPGPVSPPDHTCSSSSPHSCPLPGSAGGGGGPSGESEARSTLATTGRRGSPGRPEGAQVLEGKTLVSRCHHPAGGAARPWRWRSGLPPTRGSLPRAPGPRRRPLPRSTQSPDTLKRLPAPSQQTQPGRRGLRFWFRSAEAERPKASV